MPNSIDVSKPLAAGQTHGSLTVVGTGIRSISHFTQEAIGHIRDADAVFFAVPDGITANFIRELNPSAYNLALHYGEDKRRLITYVQMAEVILRAVRQGKRVAAVFYGHPGFFVSPARRALNIARKEGHHTEMLPGISSTDYLFSDLRIDPAVNGCQILEASDMLMRNRPVVTSSHVVLLQVGSVGDSFYSVKGFKNNKRAILFERLIELYGENHPSYHYVGATFPGLDSQIIRRPLKAYRDPKVRASVHAACTFYLPPKEVLPFDVDMVERLGMTPPQGTADKSAGGYQLRGGDYGPFELEAISLLGTEPPGGREQSTPKALYRILSQMAGSPDAAEAYRRDAKTYVSIFSGLSPAEKAALTQRSAPALHAVALQIDRTVAVPSPLPGSDNVKPAVPTAPVAAVAVGTAVKNDATELHDADELHDATELHKSDELHDASELHKADELHDASELHKADELHDASELHKADELHDASELHKADELHDASELHKADELHDASELHQSDELHDASEVEGSDTDR